MNLQEQYSEQPGFRPLYQQVRELLVSRISTGAWRPAEALPSEMALARELNVSQGTVRKAIDSLVAEKLIERRQGKGRMSPSIRAKAPNSGSLSSAMMTAIGRSRNASRR